jgi:predicted nucleic acid-binding protein
MIYLDTGCLVKLYYPEPDSAAVIRRVAGRAVFYTPLHELELTNALNQKRFHGQATEAQVNAARALIQSDITFGVLVAPPTIWQMHFQSATQLSLSHTPVIGCRSLDILHCALAADLQAAEFITTDARQSRLAQAMGLVWSPL